jgi:hypothetical protein
MSEKKTKPQIAHDAIMLSKIISEKLTLKITFPDGEYLVDQLKWHTSDYLGLKNGKVVTKSAIKYWEIEDEI